MELTSDNPFWSVQNGLICSYPTLDGDLSCDVVVVGGGISGALVGFSLIDEGVGTVLLDKRDIARGSTSGSTALLQYEVDVPLRQLIRRIGPAKANRSYLLGRDAIHTLARLVSTLKLDCAFEKKPSLFLARARREIPELREEFDLRRRIGLDLRFLEHAEIGRRFPFARPAALFSKDGGQVDPHRLTHGLLVAGCRRGLQVYDRTKVTRFTPTPRGIRLVTDKGFTIRARRAVISAGFESMTYLRGEAGTLKCTYALISEPTSSLRDWYQRCLIWESGIPYLYLRTTPDNRIIVGGEDEDFVNPTRRDALIPRKTRTLVRKFKALFPDVKLDVAYSWSGTFGETKDGLAYIGKNPCLPHAYFALGYGGNGITYSVIAAEIIRDDFLGRRNPDAPLFRFGR